MVLNYLKVPLVFITREGPEFDKGYLKEIAKWKNFNFNVGASWKNLVGSIGYELVPWFEVHGAVGASWKDILRKKFKPKFGIGFTFK